MATPKKKPEDKKPAGRPTDYRPELCVEVVELGRLGKSKAQMAMHWDVSRETIYEWARVHPEFSGALTRAMDYAEAVWEGKADTGIESMGFNSSLWGRVMAARFPATYRETTRSEVTGADGGSVKTEEVGKGFGGLAQLITLGKKVAKEGKDKGK